MTEGVVEALRVGDRRTLGASAEVAKRILSDASLLPELMEAFTSADKGLLSRASDCLEKVAAQRPELVQPYKDVILQVITRIDQWEVREHVCLLLPRLRLTAGEGEQAIEALRLYLEDKSSIVRTFAMDTMWQLAANVPGLEDEAREVVESAATHGTPAMKARARRLLERKKGQTAGSVPQGRQV